MSFSWNKDSIQKDEKVFDVDINDSTSIQIDLHYNVDTLPGYYFSHVTTPVCKEGLCYIMVIDLYWDLLGNFLKYELDEDHPLTKFDHEEFVSEDHEKMNTILANKDSFLRFYKLENLIDTTINKKSQVVDGVSGATHKSIQNEVVSGAVFSTYVLWHIVNGQVADKVLKHTESLDTDRMLVQFFESDNYHYQYYALNELTEESASSYLPQIIRLIAEGVAYVPYFAVEKLPSEAWESATPQVKIISLLRDLDFEMQNELLNRIEGISISQDALEVLILSLDQLKGGQQVKALNILKDNSDRFNDKSINALLSFSKGADTEIANLANDILLEKQTF